MPTRLRRQLPPPLFLGAPAGGGVPRPGPLLGVAPPVPAGSDVLHSPAEINEYAAWLEQRVLQFDREEQAAVGASNAAATQMHAQWQTWRIAFQAYLAQFRARAQAWSPIYAAMPGVQLVNPYIGAWETLQARNVELAAMQQTLAAGGAAVTDIPTPTPGGTAGLGLIPDKSTLIAIAIVGALAVGAYLYVVSAPVRAVRSATRRAA